jgi:hypothetical protein
MTTKCNMVYTSKKSSSNSPIPMISFPYQIPLNSLHPNQKPITISTYRILKQPYSCYYKNWYLTTFKSFLKLHLFIYINKLSLFFCSSRRNVLSVQLISKGSSHCVLLSDLFRLRFHLMIYRPSTLFLVFFVSIA